MRPTIAFILLTSCAAASPAPSGSAAPDATAPEVLRAPVARAPVVPFGEASDEANDDSHLTEAPAGDTCAAADDNLSRELSAVLAMTPPRGPAAPITPWDHRTAPLRMNVVERRLQLRPAERAQVQREGFAVLERQAYDTWAWAFHDVYQSQLPLYVSADAVMHAVYITHDRLVAELESTRLAPALTEAVDAMHLALPALAPELPADTTRDLDVYLTVARALLRGEVLPSASGADEEVRALLQKVEAAEGIGEVTLFGRARLVDFSQYRPRGHYTEGGLARFFRGAMWLSRVEFNVVTRSCQSSSPTGDTAETPREALDALALSELAKRSHADASLDRVERAWEVFAGRREDLSRADLAGLRDRAGIRSLRANDVFPRLRGAIGDGYVRTARVHPMAEGCGELPVIATLLGPRITADTAALRPLTHTEVPDRHRVHAADVAYVLGHTRARQHLADDVQAFPTLSTQLDVARDTLAHAPDDRSLYGAWLGAIRGLAAPVEGALPSYATRDSFADLRINSAVAAYAQLRHNHVLMAGQAYDEGGCVIPDAFVEPVPAVWNGLLAYTRRLTEVLDDLGEPPSSPKRVWLVRTERTLQGLRAITAMELSNHPLPPEALRWLSMVVEMRPGSSDGPPTYSGWYFDLFRRRQDEGLADARLIADYYTSWWHNEVSYAGVDRPRLGVFVVDVAGEPRAFVGPVAAAYEHHGSTAQRLTDDDAHALTPPREGRPWAASYEVAAPGVVPMRVSFTSPDTDPSGPALTLQSNRALPRVHVELLDHHREPLRTYAVRVGPRPTRLTWRGTHAEAARVRVGGWDAVVPLPWTGGEFTFGSMAARTSGDADGVREVAAASPDR